MKYVIITTVLDGHNGLGTPDADVVETKDEALERLNEWAENNSSDEDAESIRFVIDGWDGKETLDLRNGDGEGIVVRCKSSTKRGRV